MSIDRQRIEAVKLLQRKGFVWDEGEWKDRRGWFATQDDTKVVAGGATSVGEKPLWEILDAMRSSVQLAMWGATATPNHDVAVVVKGKDNHDRISAHLSRELNFPLSMMASPLYNPKAWPTVCGVQIRYE